MPSYRAGGYWATVLSQVKAYKATRSVFVTTKFGHNDQKVAAYEAAYSAYLKQFVLDVDNAGGIPVRYPYLASPKRKTKRYRKEERKRSGYTDVKVDCCHAYYPPHLLRLLRDPEPHQRDR